MGGGNQIMVMVVLLFGAIVILLMSFLFFYVPSFMASMPMSFEGALTTVITAILCYFLPAVHFPKRRWSTSVCLLCPAQTCL